MKRIDAYTPDELEQQFRMAVAKRLGFKKGNISQALEQAIRHWVAESPSRPMVERQKVVLRAK